MKSIIGFDIGTQEIKLIQWDGQCVQRTATVPTPDNLVKGGQILSYDAMADLLREAVREHHISGKNCAVVLPGSQAMFRRLRMPVMSDEQLAVNLPFEFRNFLTQDKDKYVYDYAVLESQSGAEEAQEEMDLIACATPREVMEQYRAMFRRAGLRLVTAVPVEAAFSNLLEWKNLDPDQNYCIVDLGHSGSRAYMYRGSQYETSRSIELGLGMLDQAVAEDRGVDIHRAHGYVQANKDGVLDQDTAKNLFQKIAFDVRKTVNFYEFNHRGAELNGIWCVGGGAETKPLLDAIAQMVENRVCRSEELLPPCAEPGADLGSFAAALGTVLQ